MVVNVVVVGPFEEDEEGTGLASDVVKVEGEDPATPGPLKRNDPGTVTIPQYRVNKTKQHTQKILGSKREDRFSNPFFEVVQKTCQIRFSYLLRHGNLCKGPRTLRKFPPYSYFIATCICTTTIDLCFVLFLVCLYFCICECLLQNNM